MKKNSLVAIGTCCVDEYYHMEKVPAMGDKVICKAMEKTVGGMIGNAVAVYASYNLPTYMIDFMNTGKTALWLKEELEKQGVNTDYFGEIPSLPDPKCLIMLHEGERMIFIVNNGKKNLPLSSSQKTQICSAEYVYTTILELRALKNYTALLLEMETAGVKLVLDIEDSTITGDKEDLFILEKSKILFLNEFGEARVAEAFGKDYLAQLVKKGCTVVITLGEKGCLLKTAEEECGIPGFSVPVVDTTGAGDTFNTSFLFGLTRGYTEKEAAKFANAAAARSIGILGPRSGAAGKEAVEEFIAKKGKLTCSPEK